MGVTITGELTIDSYMAFNGETVHRICDAVGCVFTSIHEHEVRSLYARISPDKYIAAVLSDRWASSNRVCKIHRD
jgi:hypothetical protein